MKVAGWIKDKVNEEKLDVIKQDGNIFVTANPGTGKTRLLIYEYLNLLENGFAPSDILCLSFTIKAKKELEDRLLKEIKEKGIDANISDIKVHTFHSFALENGAEEEVVSSNLLRYAIYEFFKKEEVFNYGDRYLLGTIVPKMENLIRYLKSYGILPEEVNIEEVKKYIEGDKKNTKEEVEKFAEYFAETYKYYEKIKSDKGIDYSDMLLNFLNQREIPKFKYVLVDEMQDVNQIEAKIALKCAENFVCVGDKKQAIMGFQGGSISNLELFKDSNHFVLSENFRSGQEILDYAKEMFNSVDESNKEELKGLKNIENKHTQKPVVYCVEKDKIPASACELAKELSDNLEEGKSVAIIVRTNRQVAKVTKELKARNIEHSTTHFSASNDAKEEIISFIKGILSSVPEEIKNSLFSPFFPMRVQDAFELAKSRKRDIINNCPKLKELRNKINNLRDVDFLFEEYIIPFSVAYGGEYLLASLSVREAYQEALRYLGEMDYKSLIDFISSANLLNQSVDTKNKIVVTTVHKAKGLEYDKVIYLPQERRDNSNFQDRTVESILKTEGIDSREELKEESLRIDFVAYTRAENGLYIMTPDSQKYISEYAETGSYSPGEEVSSDLGEKSKKAFSLFVSGKYEEAREYLENETTWFFPFIKSHFDNLDKISFSNLNEKPFDYLKKNILDLKEVSPALDLGSIVHKYAEEFLRGENPEIAEGYEEYCNNVKEMVNEIKEVYPKVESIEDYFNYTIRDLFGIDSDFRFSGKIDSVFSNEDEYLLVDWKTSKDDSRSSEHRQQLSAYKKALSIMKDIPEEKVKVAIGYVGLRPKINTGNIDKKIDDSQPRKSALNTISKKVSKVIEWKDNPDKFFEDFVNQKTSDVVEDKLRTALCEQVKKEKSV